MLRLDLRQRLPHILSYAGSSVSLLGGSVAQLAAFAILARALGVEQFGVFLAITAVTNIGVQLCGLGAMEPLVRRTARDHALYPKFLGHNIVLSIASGIVITLALMAVLPRFFPDDISTGEAIWLAAAFGFTNTIILRGILLTEQIFIAHSDFTRANVVVFGFGIMRVVTAALAAFGFGLTNLETWVWWHAGGHLLMLAACVVLLRKLGKPVFELQSDEIKRGLFFCWAQLGMALRQNIDLLILGLVATPALVGSFGVARRIADTSYLTVSALNRITYPRLSVEMEHGIGDGISISLRVLAAAVAISIATAVGVYVVAPILPILFGHEYADMVPFLRAMCWVVIPFSIAAVGAEVLGASGHHGIRAMIFNTTILGSVFIGIMTYLFLATGTIIALYIVEVALAAAFWVAVGVLIFKETPDATLTQTASKVGQLVLSHAREGQFRSRR